MSNYKRGVVKEREIQKILEAAGYITTRTAGSHGLYDVIAEGPTGIRLIQVKRVQKGGNWQHEFEIAKEALKERPRLANVSREIWVWEDSKGWIKQEVV